MQDHACIPAHTLVPLVWNHGKCYGPNFLFFWAAQMIPQAEEHMLCAQLCGSVFFNIVFLLSPLQMFQRAESGLIPGLLALRASGRSHEEQP